MRPPQIRRPLKDWIQVDPVDLRSIPADLENVPGVRIDPIPDGERLERTVRIPANALEPGVRPVEQLFRMLRLDHPLPPTARKRSDVVATELHDYQVRAVEHLLRGGGVVLADQMGAGKTRSAAVAALFAQRDHGGPIFILAPKHLRETWYDELTKIGAVACPLDWHALETTSPDLSRWQDGATFYFCHYDIVEAWWSWLWVLRPSCVILDEAHNVKNPRTKRARGANLATAIAPYRFLLTGTPIENRVAEAWRLLDLAAGKHSFGTRTAFRRRYAGAYHDGFGWRDGEPSNTDELRARIAPHYLRRTVDEVALELPPITRQVIEVDTTAAQMARYAKAFKGRDPKAIVAALLEQRASKQTLELLDRSRKVASEAKQAATTAEIASALEQGEDVVCFSWMQRTANQFWTKAGPSYPGGAVHGGMSQRERQAFLAEWQRKGGLLSATYGALGEGVNLQRARVIILHDMMWKTSTLLQGEARVWRQGQQQPVLSRWMVARGTLDELFARLLQRKAQEIGEAIGDNQPMVVGDLLNEFQDEAEQRVEQLLDSLRRWRE